MFPTGGSTYLFERLMLSGKTLFVVSVAVLAQVEVRTCRAMGNIGNLCKRWGVASSETVGGMWSMLRNWQAFMENYVRASWIQRGTSQLTFRPLPAWAVWVSSYLKLSMPAPPQGQHLSPKQRPLCLTMLSAAIRSFDHYQMEDVLASKETLRIKKACYIRKEIRNHLFVCANQSVEKVEAEWSFLLLKTL